ncbi:hypothetical protein FPZ49_32080 [Paenibacillus cremeus]|uniref:Uncharacterized protein n=1 Tax=Paenibacillus cremeus TaxID=2163881 RepID=A0A559JPS2_9BACL|nr:hypothetical protein FPZ49_32080 [Paenibacillus cremeus]
MGLGLNRFVRVRFFSGFNFTGRSLTFTRGVAVPNLGVFGFNNIISSFQLRNVVFPGQVTLILFSGLNFTGNFRIFRGSQNIRDLRAFNFNNVTSSFILVGFRLTASQIRSIQNTGKMPSDITML